MVNLRIAWLQTAPQLADNVDDPDVDSRFAPAMFLNPRDCQQAMLAASTAELGENLLQSTSFRGTTIGL